ncbi:MAG TPA: hypothetical protein VLT16_05295 [Candidatus Limnocylindrales bacterium]|nr:hypothetical protein [Candidatus Limnocylindrales bacterium]
MKRKIKNCFLITSALLALALAAGAQQHAHQHDMDRRGEQGMGFSQEKTTHHFLLRKDGGAIQVTARSADDKASVEQIRQHLRHITHAFESGDFNIPMFVHDQTPPGVPVMTRLKDQISYKYEPVENGGRVVIKTGNADALAAVHEFLRFQIREHRTGDPLELKQ